MKQIDIQSIHSVPLTLKSIYSVNMTPRLKVFKTCSRNRNGFLYLLDGKIEYIFGQTVLELEPGALIYLPYQSNHTYKALTEKVRYIRLDFSALDYASQETVVFSKTPLLITKKLDGTSEGILVDITSLCVKGDIFDQLKLNALLYEFLDRIVTLIRNRTNKRSGNIATNVLNFIMENYTENITEELLCNKFHVNASYIRREFKKYTGFTITNFINRYRIKQSLTLLTKSDLSILDIALAVGYSDATYFCRVFKKLMHTSPLQYRIETF